MWNKRERLGHRLRKIVYFLNDVDISYAIAYTVVDRAHHA